MEWAKKIRASPITKPAMEEMLQIIKVDERPTGVAFPSDRLWAEFLYRYAPSVSGMNGDAIEQWLRR